MAYNSLPGKPDKPRLRLVIQDDTEGATPAPQADIQGLELDPAEASLRLIDSMSRRIDVLAREHNLDGDADRPRAA